MRRGRPQRSQTLKRGPRARANDEIRVREIRVIDEEGEQLGIMQPDRAMEIAQQRGLDLVEVAPNADPPVCRIMNYGKYIYDQEKRARQARKAQKQTEIKEIRLKPNMAEHDIEYRVRHAAEFLREGNKVRATVRFYGRQIIHRDLGYKLLEDFAASLDEISEVEQPPRMDGRQMSILINPRPEAVED